NNGYRFTGAAVGRGDLPGPLGHDLLLRLPREPAGIEHPRVPPVARVVVRGEEVHHDPVTAGEAHSVELRLLSREPGDDGEERGETAHLLRELVGPPGLPGQVAAPRGAVVQRKRSEGNEPADGDDGANDVEQFDGGDV